MTRRKPLAGIYQLTTFLALVLLLLILFISAAYFFLIPAPEKPSGQGDLLAELATNRSTWESERPASYRYVVDRDCYCGPAYVEAYVATEQRGSRSAAFTIEIETATGEFISAPPGPVWIDDLFDLIEQSIRDEKAVDVEYHEDLGFPVSIVRDFEVLEYR
jgi:hypothetical protein